MERTELKWLTGVFGLLVMIMLFLFSQSLTSHTSERSKSFEDWMTVAMPRPIKEMITGFSLANRNISRQLTTFGVKRPAYNKSIKGTGSPTKAAVDKEKARNKNAKAWADYRAREKAFRTRIIAESERYRQSLINQAKEKMAQDYQDYQEFSEGFKKKAEAKANTNEEVKKNEDKEVMDAAAWKSLVLAQPTSENVHKMMKAFQDGELDAATYFEIVDTLIHDNNEERRKMGMWAVTNTFHPQAFTMAAHLVTEVDAENQKKLKDYMYGYNRTQTLAHLDIVLRSQDAVAAAAAADVITKAIEKLRAGQAPVATDHRGQRITGQTQTLTLASYQRFVPTLQWLSTNTGNTLSQWASNLLSQLRTTTTPA